MASTVVRQTELAVNRAFRDENGALVITRLPVEQMGILALGLALTGEEKRVLEALLAGRKVRVLETGLEYKEYRKTAPLGVYQKFTALERELREMGVCVVRNRDR